MSRPKYKDYEYGMSGETPMCCWTCAHRKWIERWDYTDVRKQGVPKTAEEGFACLGLVHEGIVIKMIGLNEDTEYCEMWEERKDL